jgi:hypothetical protein
MVTAVPARSGYPFVVPPRATPYTPLQLLFLTRLAHLVALCYHGRHTSGEGHGRHTSGEGTQRELLRHALSSTIDDCFTVGLAPELLALLADEAAQLEA